MADPTQDTNAETDAALPAATPAGAPPPAAPAGAAASVVVVKKYANRRLYNTESSSYITLDNLADMVREGRDFVVYDAKSGDDITRFVLTQIIVEEESKGRALLPTGFLRQLIGFYGDSLQGFVPRYLEQAMASFARQQEQVRKAMQHTMQQGLAPFIPFPIEEVGRQNMAMMERAMTLFSPFYREPEAAGTPAPAGTQAPAGTPASGAVPAAAPAGQQHEIDRLRAEVESLRGQLAAATREAPKPIASLAETRAARGEGGKAKAG